MPLIILRNPAVSSSAHLAAWFDDESVIANLIPVQVGGDGDAKERAGNNFLISSWRFGAGLQTPPSAGP